MRALSDEEPLSVAALAIRSRRSEDSTQLAVEFLLNQGLLVRDNRGECHMTRAGRVLWDTKGKRFTA
ncbi:hypothetical protein [Nocardia sp. NPDC051981]|uniref:hypothetical protein n=1 Tax=Nocardia sp. NPDC051981 TaxID=3155417 RepID=UPI003438F996